MCVLIVVAFLFMRFQNTLCFLRFTGVLGTKALCTKNSNWIRAKKKNKHTLLNL